MAAAGIGIVLLGVFTYTPSKPGPPDNLLEPGSCVVLEDNGDASEVNCDTDHDGVVVSLITGDQRCPTDSNRTATGRASAWCAYVSTYDDDR